MKENDMLEQMFSAVAQLLGQREEALLQKVEALEKRVEELEQKLQEAAQAGVPAAAVVAGIGENVGEDVVEEIDEDVDEEIAGVDVQDDVLVEVTDEEVLEAEDYDGDKQSLEAEDDILEVGGEFEVDGEEEEILVAEEVPGDDEVLDVEEDVFDEEEADDEDVLEAEDVGGNEDVLEVEEIEGDEIEGDEIEVDDDMDGEPEMEIELEFFDDDGDGWAEEYNEGDVEDAVAVEVGTDVVREVAETDDEEGPVLVVDKARPDWYDWEVDIPGAYIEDIWDGIGLNDRLLFLKELFRGDEIDFSETLDALNEMSTLVEAVEYIRGRYSFWDEESDEVYRFYMTVRRRFNKQRHDI